MAEDIKILKVKGKLMWPKLFVPDTKFDPRWTADLLLDAEGLKIAAAESLRVKTRDAYKGLFDGYDGSYLPVTRDVLDKRKGEDRDPPVVKDNTGTRDVPTNTGIGNGTDAMVRFIVKTRDMNGTFVTPEKIMEKHNGYGMFLTGVQIINLIPYENVSDPDTDFVSEEGSYNAAGGDDGFDFVKSDDPFADSA